MTLEAGQAALPQGSTRTCERLPRHAGQPHDGGRLGGCAEPPGAPRDKGYEVGSRTPRAGARGPGRPRPSCWGSRAARSSPPPRAGTARKGGEEAQTACQGAEDANLGSLGWWWRRRAPGREGRLQRAHHVRNRRLGEAGRLPEEASGVAGPGPGPVPTPSGLARHRNGLTFEQLQLSAALLVQVTRLGHPPGHGQQVLGADGLHGDGPVHLLGLH